MPSISGPRSTVASNFTVTPFVSGATCSLLIVLSSLYFQGLTRELTDFLPWQWARPARLTGQKVRSNDWFAPQSGAGLSGGLTQSGNSRVRTAKRCERIS
jgi:hypothetical protein